MPVCYTRPPYARILWLDQALAGGRRLNAALAGRELEVTARTVYRDLEFLRDRLGAPLVWDQQSRSYRYSDPDYRLPAVHFSEGELLAVAVGARALRQYAGTPFARQLREALAKLCQALPGRISVDLGLLADSISFDPGPARPVNLEIFRQLEQALRERRVLRFRYWSAGRNEERERRAEPLHLHNSAGDWYLIAWDQDRQAPRNFALSRIKTAGITRQNCIPRPGFDLSSYLEEHFAGFRGAGPVEVAVRFDSFASRWIREKQWPGEVSRRELGNSRAELPPSLQTLHPGNGFDSPAPDSGSWSRPAPREEHSGGPVSPEPSATNGSRSCVPAPAVSAGSTGLSATEEQLIRPAESGGGAGPDSPPGPGEARSPAGAPAENRLPVMESGADPGFFPDFDGGLELRFQVFGLEGILPWIRSFGPRAEVLAPPELRRRLAAETARQVELYGQPPQPPGQPVPVESAPPPPAGFPVENNGEQGSSKTAGNCRRAVHPTGHDNP